MATDGQIRAALRAIWHVTASSCALAEAGDPGPADDWRWSATIDAEHYLIRTVPAGQRFSLVAALTVMDVLGSAGVSVGVPVRTADGALTATVGLDEMAVLREPAGRPLDGGDPLDQQWWGDLLGRAHRELRSFQQPWLSRLAWPDPDAPHLFGVEWLRPLLADVTTVVTRLTVTDQLTYGVLHGNPIPALFRIDVETGRTALAGWGAPAIGPLVYDVACAVRHAGGRSRAEELLDGYLAAGPVDRDEIDAALPAMARLHWAFVADGYARALRAPIQSPADGVAQADEAARAYGRLQDRLEEARQTLTRLAARWPAPDAD